MKRQTGVRQSTRYSAPLFIALFSILLPGRLVALDLELMRVGGYDTSGYARGVTVSGNYAYVADGTRGLQVIDKRRRVLAINRDQFCASAKHQWLEFRELEQRHRRNSDRRNQQMGQR